jgi:hypothetical protein
VSVQLRCLRRRRLVRARRAAPAKAGGIGEREQATVAVSFYEMLQRLQGVVEERGVLVLSTTVSLANVQEPAFCTRASLVLAQWLDGIKTVQNLPSHGYIRVSGGSVRGPYRPHLMLEVKQRRHVGR